MKTRYWYSVHTEAPEDGYTVYITDAKNNIDVCAVSYVPGVWKGEEGKYTYTSVFDGTEYAEADITHWTTKKLFRLGMQEAAKVLENVQNTLKVVECHYQN